MGFRRIGHLIALAAALTAFVFGLVWLARASADANLQYFPETGHTVRGIFLRYYRSFPDAELVFGYPITEEFHDERCQNGALCQFFQRALFTLQGDKVVLASLGEAYYTATRGAPGIDRRPLRNLLPADTPGCREYDGGIYGVHPVCYEFLPFYERHRVLLGRVVSDPLLENGVPVQYFEGARLEYRTTPHGNSVVVSNLGEWFFNRLGLMPSLLNPVQMAGNAPRVLRLNVGLAVDRAVVEPGARQKVFVMVYDQLGQPVAGAQVVVWLGKTPRAQGITDKNGLWVDAFAVPERAGDFEVQATAEYAGLKAVGYNSFRVWP